MPEVAIILQNQFMPFPSKSFGNLEILGYTVDSRAVKAGDLFIALKGEKIDGHSFLYDVEAKGAVGAIVSKKYQGIHQNLPLIKVDDPLTALQTLAKSAIFQTSPRIVGITGSLGKTSTKEFTTRLLSTKYLVGATPGNNNSQVGLPLAILNHTTGKEEILVLEMGMTLPGHISRLIEIAPPEIALITTVALVHACQFDSLEEIVRTKGEIFSHPSTRLGIYPLEIDSLSSFGCCKKMSYSIRCSSADFYLKEDQLYINGDESYQLAPFMIPGKHNRHNLLAAIAIARYFNVDWEAINQTIPLLTLPDKRLQFVETKDILFINDAYNAAEQSVIAALETIPQPKGNGKKIAVLGSMLELGKFSDDCHRKVGEHALNYVERMYCLGDECLPMVELWKIENRPIQHFNDLEELIAVLKIELEAGDVVLLKGSRAKELWKVIDSFERGLR